MASGPAAIEAVNRDDYRVIIADYGLPGADRLQVLLCDKARTPDIHVIVITGQPTRNRERFARDIGAFEFLEKPFPFSVLKETVNFALATPERRKGPRGCCCQCTGPHSCEYWALQEPARVD